MFAWNRLASFCGLAGLLAVLTACSGQGTDGSPSAPTPESPASETASAVVSSSFSQKIEAENYSQKSGVSTEPCSDAGGGSDVGWIDKGDWMIYPISIPASGPYTISYRVASPNSGVYLSSDLNAGATPLGNVTIQNTGGWQKWATVTQTVQLTAGNHNFGINGGSGGFNINWFSIDAVSSVLKIEAESFTAKSGVDTESCSDAGGGLDVGWIDQGDWMIYSVTIKTAGRYTIQYRVASPYSGKYLSSDLNSGATQLGTVAIQNTGGWQNWATVSQVADLPAGTFNFGINAGSGGFNLNWFTITPGGTPPPPTKSAKRGIAYDLQTAADLGALKNGVSWWYNWAPGTGAPANASSTYGMDYIPMSWNGNNIGPGGDVDKYLTAHPECRYLLVMNEPNFWDQANKTIAEVVALWPQIEAMAQKHGVKIVGPALNWGTVNSSANPSNPITWLDGFFAQFRARYGREPQVDALAFHWYDYGLVGSGTGFLDDPTKLPKYGKKIWVTEFANWHTNPDGAQIDSVAKQKEQMRQWVSWMETHDIVERYAWFTGRQPGNPCFISIFQNYGLDASKGDGALSELGTYYVNLPVGQ